MKMARNLPLTLEVQLVAPEWSPHPRFEQILYFLLNFYQILDLQTGVNDLPSVFYLHLFQKKTIADKWLIIFYKLDSLPAAQPTVSKH